MDSLIAVSGRDFVLMASDVTSARSIVVMKEDMDKIMELDEHKLLGFAGESGDCSAFTEYIQKNVHLFALRSGITLDTHAVGNFTRNELAVALRYVRRPPCCAGTGARARVAWRGEPLSHRVAGLGVAEP